MAGTVKRERQLARERYERQQARRRAAAARRRRAQQGAAVAFAVLLVVGGMVALALALGGDDRPATVATEDTSSPTTTPSTSASSSPSASAAGCTFSKTQDKAARDVGLPTYDRKTATTPLTAKIVTDQGPITVELAADKAPCTTTSFRHLAQGKYFDNTQCHRLTTENIYVLQCGDPSATGSGGPGYQFAEENLPAQGESNYPAGTVAMANAGSGTNGSQFFLVYEDTTLPPSYTIFGRITDGLDVVSTVAAEGVEGDAPDGKPAQPVTIKRVTLGKA